MSKGKLIPILLAIILLVLAIILIGKTFFGYKKNYSKIIASYNNQNNEYSDIKVDNVIVINNVSFWIKSIESNQVILQSNKYLKDDEEKDINEYILKVNISTKACFEDESCVLFSLS